MAESSTLCWDCRRNAAECPWIHKGVPVPGWVAESTKIKYTDKHVFRTDDSFRVISCPLHIPPVTRYSTRKKTMTMSAYYNRSRYERMKAAGICVTCGHAEAAPGHSRCAVCMEKFRARDRERYARKKVKSEEESEK